MEDEGNEGLTILCNNLLIKFQNFLGFVRLEDKREKVECLVFIMIEVWLIENQN